MLDALDECSPEEDVTDMLRVLLHLNTELRGPKLRIFITSRPEAHIRFVFTSQVSECLHAKVVLHDIDEKIARNDIETFLKAEFAEMHKDSHNLGVFPDDWPASEDLDTLLDRVWQVLCLCSHRDPVYWRRGGAGHARQFGGSVRSCIWTTPARARTHISLSTTSILESSS